MLGVSVHPTFSVRGAGALFLASALILPPPGQCASCDAGGGNCSQGELATANQHAVRPCCQRHAAAHSRSAIAKDNCATWQSRSCNCNIRPIDRSVVSFEQVSIANHFAISHSPAPLLTAVTANFETAAASFANLPPPVPHRILHCSWII
jgi:hypothetical protein